MFCGSGKVKRCCRSLQNNQIIKKTTISNVNVIEYFIFILFLSSVIILLSLTRLLVF